MAQIGPARCREILQVSLAELPGAIAASAATVYVPWQDCRLSRADVLVARMVEIVVHIDDLAQSLHIPTPTLDLDVLDPVLGVLSSLAVQRHGQHAVLRALSRTERAGSPISAF